MVRRDLNTVRNLAIRVADDAEAGEIRTEIASLQVDSPIWKLRVNCLYYCRFVHGHHQMEDIALFPALRRTNPALSPIVDRLENDHRVVSDLLDAVEEAADNLEADERSRTVLVASLNRLADLLLAHLSYEEEHVAPTIRTWTEWPAH
jgi:hypothetical protein